MKIIPTLAHFTPTSSEAGQFLTGSHSHNSTLPIYFITNIHPQSPTSLIHKAMHTYTLPLLTLLQNPPFTSLFHLSFPNYSISLAFLGWPYVFRKPDNNVVIFSITTIDYSIPIIITSVFLSNFVIFSITFAQNHRLNKPKYKIFSGKNIITK
jgi:hypothetical protein